MKEKVREPGGTETQLSMAAPQHAPGGAAACEGYGTWQLYNFLRRHKQQEKLPDDTQGVPGVAEVTQSSKDVVLDGPMVKNFKIIMNPMDREHPPVLSEPLPIPRTPRHTPPQLSPVTDVGQVALRGPDSHAGNPPERRSWQYQLLPTSDNSPTAIRAKLTRTAQHDDDSEDEEFSPEENGFNEVNEDALSAI